MPKRQLTEIQFQNEKREMIGFRSDNDRDMLITFQDPKTEVTVHLTFYQLRDAMKQLLGDRYDLIFKFGRADPDSPDCKHNRTKGNICTDCGEEVWQQETRPCGGCV